MNAEDVSSAIILSRDQRGWRDRARSYDVVIDGEHAAKIKRGQSVEVPITSGHHEIFTRINWGRSQSIQLDIPPGESIQLICRPGRAQLGAGYISLSRV